MRGRDAEASKLLKANFASIPPSPAALLAGLAEEMMNKTWSLSSSTSIGARNSTVGGCAQSPIHLC